MTKRYNIVVVGLVSWLMILSHIKYLSEHNCYQKHENVKQIVLLFVSECSRILKPAIAIADFVWGENISVRSGYAQV